jgi:predicted anti-sigma-YlaC factor YlaD
MTCQETTLSLGVYLLGALEPTEQAAVDAHLADCSQCRSQLAELAELPSMLGRISLDDIAPEPVVPSNELYERVAARARAEGADELASRRRRYRRLTAVAAAFAIVVGGGFGTWAIVNGNSSNPSGPPPGVHMSVALASQATGTGYTLEVSGLPIDEHCKLIAVAKDGSRDVAGQWDATYQGWAKETGSTSIPRSELARFVLLGTRGERLATVAV